MSEKERERERERIEGREKVSEKRGEWCGDLIADKNGDLEGVEIKRRKSGREGMFVLSGKVDGGHVSFGHEDGRGRGGGRMMGLLSRIGIGSQQESPRVFSGSIFLLHVRPTPFA